MGNNITEQEIQYHKNNIDNLITKLINTHNLEEEDSINNEIKKENEFLTTLLNIKINELNQYNNMNNNQLQQQQVMQLQMMQQQMMADQVAQAQQAPMQNFPNNAGPMPPNFFSNSQNQAFNVIFKVEVPGRDYVPLIIQCTPDEKVSEIIEKYRKISGDYDFSKVFRFMSKILYPLLSVAEARIENNSIVFVNKPFDVIFIREQNFNSTTIQCISDDKVFTIIEKYRSKSGDKDPDNKFKFNNKFLYQDLSVAEAGITKNSKIYVIKVFDVIFKKASSSGQEADSIIIQCRPDEKVKEIIEKYRKKSGDNEPTKKFKFNNKFLSPNLSVAEAGITNNSNILVYKEGDKCSIF